MIGPELSEARVVCTRFFMRLSVDQPVAREWLVGRLVKFRASLLPSMMGQAVPPDAWLIFLREDTPADLVAEIEKDLPDFACLVLGPDLFGDIHLAASREILRRFPGRDRYVTTRIDNDDMVSSDFLERIYARSNRPGLYGLNLPIGLQIRECSALLWVDLSNSFLTLVEPAAAQLLTVFDTEHGLMDRRFRIHQIIAPPSWVMALHDDNLANGEFGLSWRPSQPMVARFPALSDQKIVCGKPRGSWHAATRMFAKSVRSKARQLKLVAAGRW